MVNQDGLEWVQETFGLEPHWTEDPDITILTQIAHKHLSVPEDGSLQISFFAQGAFNKLYKVSVPSSDYLMRVSLPVDPHHKTESEVATIEFVRKETEMPVPRIIAYDSDSGNELGFEWMLMEMMPGVPLRKRWRKMSWEAKEEIVRRLVKYQAQLFEKRFEQIGNIFVQEKEVHDEADRGLVPKERRFILGRLVSLIFFWGDHLTHDVPRGPFKSSYDWLHTRLQFILTDQERILKTSDDEDEIEDAEFAKDLAEKLLQVLPTVFPPDSAEAEPSVLFHDDLSMQNILVDEGGKMTAIIDWECVSALPLWRACQLPELLEGAVRIEKPRKENYAPESEDEGQDSLSPNVLDNEGVDELYWDHLLDYERTQLRKLFVDEMRATKPDWVATMETSSLKADFGQAVHDADNGWRFKIIREWVEAFLTGDVYSLRERMMG